MYTLIFLMGKQLRKKILGIFLLKFFLLSLLNWIFWTKIERKAAVKLNFEDLAIKK